MSSKAKRALPSVFRAECSSLKPGSLVSVKACHQAKLAVALKGCKCWTVRLTLRLTVIMVAAIYATRPSVWSGLSRQVVDAVPYAIPLPNPLLTNAETGAVGNSFFIGE